MKCVYVIINNVNDKIYVGSTKDIDKRKTRHLCDLKGGKHHNIYLQRSVEKYGLGSFELLILEEIQDISDLFDRERYWIAKLTPEYNIGSVGGGDNLTNHPDRNNIILKIKVTINDNLSKMTKEERRDKWGRPGSSNPNWRGGSSTKTCPYCGKLIAPINNTCIDCMDRSGANNPFFGKKHSEESKEKMRQAAMGHLPVNSKTVIALGVEYPSMASAARACDITNGAMHYRINSTSKKWVEFFYKTL